MHTIKAKPFHLSGVNALLGSYGFSSITHDHLNGRDIALIAVTDRGETVGFIWAGLMAKGTRAYVDHFVVSRDCAGQGVGNLLCKALLEEGLKRRVREAFGVIRQGQHHDKSAMNALKMAWGAHSAPYTYVCADLQHIVSELGGV